MFQHRSNNAIKHDLRERRFSFIGAVVCSILAGVNIAILNTDTDMFSSDLLAVLAILSGVILPPAALVLWLFWFDCISYLRRLKKHGYMLPKNKKEVDNGLAGLRGGIADMENNTEGKCTESIALTMICFIISIAILISTVCFFLQYNRFLSAGNMIIFGVVHIAMFLVWLGLGLRFDRQSDNSKYKDDVEPDAGRKPRTSIEEGILLIIVLSVITFLVSYSLYSAAHYMSHAARLLAEHG